ncbi:MAG: 23S rRNA (guanosine(2251)-2'-O)-methyltransferase RlmB [Elusimicrobiota bacterium]
MTYNKNIVDDSIIYGRQPVYEILKNRPKDIVKLYITEGIQGGIIDDIIALAQKNRVTIIRINGRELERITSGSNHQGVLAEGLIYKPGDWTDVLNSIVNDSIIVALAEVEDPRNVGAIIRTAAGFGVKSVVMTKHRSAGLSPAAAKTSAGGIEYVDTVIANSLPQRMDELKKSNVWVYGADSEGEDIQKVKFTYPCCLVLGGENTGLPRLVNEKCDFKVSIPIKNIQSYNVSVAAGIILYEMYKQKPVGKK